jgi:hypothetical protein
MLFASSTLLLLVNAGTLSRERSILFNRVAFLTLVYSGALWFNKLNIILLSTVIAMYEGLFHSSITHSFALFLRIIATIVLQLIVYYPRRSQIPMGARGKEMSSFSLTKYTIKIFNRFVSVLTRYLLIRFISLKMQLYNRYSDIFALVNTVVLFWYYTIYILFIQSIYRYLI